MLSVSGLSSFIWSLKNLIIACKDPCESDEKLADREENSKIYSLLLVCSSNFLEFCCCFHHFYLNRILSVYLDCMRDTSVSRFH